MSLNIFGPTQSPQLVFLLTRYPHRFLIGLLLTTSCFQIIRCSLLMSLKCIFVGYSRVQIGYRCYCPPLRRYFVSTDVTFFETTPIFPSVYCCASRGGRRLACLYSCLTHCRQRRPRWKNLVASDEAMRPHAPAREELRRGGKPCVRLTHLSSSCQTLGTCRSGGNTPPYAGSVTHGPP